MLTAFAGTPPLRDRDALPIALAANVPSPERFYTEYVLVTVNNNVLNFACVPQQIFNKIPVSGPGRRDELTMCLKETAGGCEKSFERLYRLTSSKMLGYAKLFVNNHALAEEVVQESFISIWKNSKSFNPNLSSAFTWMRVIVKNKAFDAYRITLTRPISTFDIEDIQVEGTYESPCAYVERLQFLRHVEDTLSKLRPGQANAIVLAFFSGLSYSEIANSINKPEGTVKTWIRRGLLEMRREFKHDYVRNE